MFLAPLLNIKRQWLVAQLTQHRELGYAGVVVGGAITVDLLVNHARDHRDLVGVVSRTSCLETEGQSLKWRCLFVELFDLDLDLLGRVYDDFVLGPGLLVVLTRFSIFDG